MSNQIKPGSVTVSTYRYECEYGKKPRGYAGAWVFAPNHNAPEDSYFWGKGMYKDAKKAAQEHFAAQGINACVVLT